MCSGYFTKQISGCSWPEVGYSTGLNNVSYKTKEMLKLFKEKYGELKKEVIKYEEYRNTGWLVDRIEKKNKKKKGK